MSMTRQEQLDAVVRNYGEWPAGSVLAHVCESTACDVGFSKNTCSVVGQCLNVYEFTRTEVEQRKAELQNKPVKWPEFVNLIVQDQDGDWFYGSYKDAIISYGSWTGVGEGMFYHAGKGEVIGDWRDTLEKRPEQEVTPEEEEAFNSIDASSVKTISADSIDLWSNAPDWADSYGVIGISEFAVYASEARYQYVNSDGHYFNFGATGAFSRIDYHEIKKRPDKVEGLISDAAHKSDYVLSDAKNAEMKNDAWDGEGLPPVGVLCEWSGDGGKTWYKTSLVFCDDAAILTSGYELRKTDDPELLFRTIKSDREKWKYAALHVEAELHDDYQPHELIEAIYDAGLAKLPES